MKTDNNYLHVDENTRVHIMRGNLIDLAEQGHFHVIVHGCNCFNTMGSGIAKEVKERYPQAYKIDCMTKSGHRDKLGCYSAMLGKRFNIINAYTQYDYGSDGKDRFEYEAFEKILDNLAKVYPTCSFGFPMIGMGRAGGNKDKILALLCAFAAKIKPTGGIVTVVEYEPTKKKLPEVSWSKINSKEEND